MSLTTEQRVLLTQRLADAEKAYHDLVTGRKASVIVDQNLERIEYVRTDLNKLAAYINELKRQLGLISGASQGPMQVWFR